MVPSPRGLLRLPDQSLLTETLGELGSPPCTGVCSSIRLECACVGGDGEHEGMKNVILRREQLTFGTKNSPWMDGIWMDGWTFERMDR